MSAQFTPRYNDINYNTKRYMKYTGSTVQNWYDYSKTQMKWYELAAPSKDGTDTHPRTNGLK